MKRILFVLGIVIAVAFGCSRPFQKEQVLKTMLIPMAQEFLQRNGLPYEGAFDEDDIVKWRVDFNRGKPGFAASLTLTNGFYFSFFWDGTNSEIWSFDTGRRPSFKGIHSSKDKLQALRDLSLKNQLNDETALALAEHYFTLQGHKREDFYPVEFGPYTWGKTNDPDYFSLPFYIAQWYRRDVDLKVREEGEVAIPSVTIEISGISSNIIYYSKVFMPVGRDF